jgi:hypothetical protein
MTLTPTSTPPIEIEEKENDSPQKKKVGEEIDGKQATAIVFNEHNDFLELESSSEVIILS